MFESFTKN